MTIIFRKAGDGGPLSAGRAVAFFVQGIGVRKRSGAYLGILWSFFRPFVCYSENADFPDPGRIRRSRVS
jgi:hypothetical protein